MLTSEELELMSADLAESLPESCVIQSYSSVSDGMGGNTPTWSASSTVACRISPAMQAPLEEDVAGRFAGVQQWTITLPSGTSVDNVNRITSGSRTFEIIGVLAPRSYEVSCRLVVKEAD